MTNPIIHPTGGVRTTTKEIRDSAGHTARVYGQGGSVGRGYAEHNTNRESPNWQSQHGVDIVCRSGTPVYAAFDGVIGAKCGIEAGHENDGPSSRYHGNRVYVEGTANTAFYQHLDRLSVHPGDRVHAGQLIGYSGIGGDVEHLHFSLERGNTEAQVDGAAIEHDDPVRPPAEDQKPASPHERVDDSAANFSPSDASASSSTTGAPISVEPTGGWPDSSGERESHEISQMVTPSDANATSGSTGDAVYASSEGDWSPPIYLESFDPGAAPHGGDMSFDPGAAPHAGDMSFDPGAAPHGGDMNFDPGAAPHAGDMSFDPGAAPHAGDTSFDPGAVPHGIEISFDPGVAANATHEDASFDPGQP